MNEDKLNIAIIVTVSFNPSDSLVLFKETVRNSLHIKTVSYSDDAPCPSGLFGAETLDPCRRRVERVYSRFRTFIKSSYLLIRCETRDSR